MFAGYLSNIVRNVEDSGMNKADTVAVLMKVQV